MAKKLKKNGTKFVMKRFQEFLDLKDDEKNEIKLKQDWIPYLVLASIIKECSDGNSAATVKHAHINAKQANADREDAEKERKHQRFTQLFNKARTGSSD